MKNMNTDVRVNLVMGIGSLLPSRYLLKVLLLRLEISRHGLRTKCCHWKIFLHMVLLHKSKNL